MRGSFEFLDPGTPGDGRVELHLRRCEVGGTAGGVPWYAFDIRREGTGEVVGRLALRVGDGDAELRYSGHIGYFVDPPFRGHGYAERACRLVLPLARAHGLNPLWITTDPDNAASRRICERLGAHAVETVPVPPDDPLWARGERVKVRYRLELGRAAQRPPGG
jgi:predicted acetyltransferase